MTNRARRLLILAGMLVPTSGFGQNCTLLKQTFAIADTIKPDTSQLYLFRFSISQLVALKNVPALEKAVEVIGKLQQTLDQDHESYKNGLVWQLDTKLASKQLIELKEKCGETPFLVYQREIDFYHRRYIPKKQ